MPTEDTAFFSTRDLYMASTFVTLKFAMIGMDVQYEGSRSMPVAYFKFPDSPSLQDAKRKYIQGLLMVEPKSFVLNMRALRAEIANFVNNPHKSHE